MTINEIQRRIADKLANVRSDHAAVMQYLCEYETAVAAHRSAPPCIVCGARQADDLETFREHALKLRDEGALHIAVGPMSAQFMPRYPEPVTPEAIAAAVQAKEPPEPEGDERYLP